MQSAIRRRGRIIQDPESTFVTTNTDTTMTEPENIPIVAVRRMGFYGRGGERSGMVGIRKITGSKRDVAELGFERDVPVDVILDHKCCGETLTDYPPNGIELGTPGTYGSCVLFGIVCLSFR